MGTTGFELLKGHQEVIHLHAEDVQMEKWEF